MLWALSSGEAMTLAKFPPRLDLRRPGKAEDIGYTALFLASDESSYITCSLIAASSAIDRC